MSPQTFTCSKPTIEPLEKGMKYTARKISTYGVFSGPYFPVFGLNMDQKNLRICTLFTQ